jgi:hypothetical protein
MIRSWGAVTLTGAAQPVFGDVTTAAVGLPSGAGIIAVTVASTTRYRVGDRIYLDPFQANQDLLLVGGIASSTVLNCTSEGGAPTHTHTTSAIIMLSLACLDVIVQSGASAGHAIVLGSDNTVTATPGGSAFYVIQPFTAPAEGNSFRLAGSIGNTDVCRTNDMWMIGTAADIALVSAVVL